MANLNRAQIMGRLGADPELKKLSNGNVCNFSIATTKKWKDKTGAQKEKTDWHNVSAFGGLADICVKFLSKGSEAYVEGELETRAWDEGGVKKYATSIVATNVQFLSSKNDVKKDENDDGFNF